jgi:hypothetical protein
LSDGEARDLVGALDGAQDQGHLAELAELTAMPTPWPGDRIGATLDLGPRLAVQVRDVRADGVDVELDASGAAAAAAVDHATHGDLFVVDAVLGVELRIPVELVDVAPPRTPRGGDDGDGDGVGGVATLRVTGAPVRRTFGPVVRLD